MWTPSDEVVMTASETTRGTVGRATEGTGTTNAGNPGVLIGTQDVGGQPYARYRATNGTWVSASLQEQGYAALYGRNTGYGAYTGLVRSSDGTPLTNPDRIRPGQEYLVPVLRSTQPPPAQPQGNNRTIELFSNAEDSRSTRNRYDASSQRPQVTGPLKAYAAPLVYPVARAVLSELADETLTGGGAAETLTGGGAAETLTVGAAETLTVGGAVITGGVALAAAAALGFAGYEVRRAFREYRSAEEARAEARKLLQQAQRGAFNLWQNGFITDDEYFLYLATGVLVIQPRDAPGTPPRGAPDEASRKATDERWWAIMWLGYAYNRARLFDNPFNEVIVDGADGKRYRVDAFDPGKRIISRKFTQFALISEETGIKYVREVVDKYKPGTRIAKVDSSIGVLKVTKVLTGQMVLKIPVQRHPVPRRVLEEAERLGVEIEDDFGNNSA